MALTALTSRGGYRIRPVVGNKVEAAFQRGEMFEQRWPGFPKLTAPELFRELRARHGEKHVLQITSGAQSACFTEIKRRYRLP